MERLAERKGGADMALFIQPAILSVEKKERRLENTDSGDNTSKYDSDALHRSNFFVFLVVHVIIGF